MFLKPVTALFRDALRFMRIAATNPEPKDSPTTVTSPGPSRGALRSGRPRRSPQRGRGRPARQKLMHRTDPFLFDVAGGPQNPPSNKWRDNRNTFTEKASGAGSSTT